MQIITGSQQARTLASPAITNAIREAVDAAHELRAQESALRDAVASGDVTAIVTAAQNFFREKPPDVE